MRGHMISRVSEPVSWGPKNARPISAVLNHHGTGIYAKGAHFYGVTRLFLFWLPLIQSPELFDEVLGLFVQISVISKEARIDFSALPPSPSILSCTFCQAQIPIHVRRWESRYVWKVVIEGKEYLIEITLALFWLIFCASLRRKMHWPDCLGLDF